jgi:hypothetical protein
VYVTYWSHDGTSSAGGEPASAVSLPVVGGLFTVNLGDTSLPGMTAALPDSVFTNTDVCLRLWFNDGVSGFQQLTPDQRITSAAYAFKAADAETLGGFGWDAFFNGENPLTGQINANRLVPDSITSAQIGIGAVVNDGLADGSVTTAKIADGHVTSADIQDGTITTGDLAPDSVTSSKIADGQVTSADIADATIQSWDIGTMNRLTANDGSTVVWTGGGYVGINTTSPGTTLDVNGAVIVNGSLNYPPASPGPWPTFGDHTVPLYDGNNEIWFRWVYYPYPIDENKLDIMVDNTKVKTFVIPHPTDSDRYLVHGTLEGPEAAVFYRGQGRLAQGRARINLPPFFEALSRQEGRTVQLTPMDGFDRLAIRSREGWPVKDGVLEVYSDNPASTQAFMWEVKAVRADVPKLEVEVPKTDALVRGDGPYTYLQRPKMARAEADQPRVRQP